MPAEIHKQVLDYQGGDANAALELVEKFKPLIKRYAFFLHREDSFEDLQRFLLSMLKTWDTSRLSSTDDATVTRYIANSVKNEYIALSNPMVKLEGNRQVTTLISPAYIRGAKAVQHALRQEIAARGISIETNPSSNVLISNFRRYDKHPTLSFYNRGLPVTEEEENACPQLSVSINTDDKGVFYTDLENEFALLARSLEECMDAHEQPRFRKNDIYAWLDNIRIMGLEQGFVSE